MTFGYSLNETARKAVCKLFIAIDAFIWLGSIIEVVAVLALNTFIFIVTHATVIHGSRLGAIPTRKIIVEAPSFNACLASGTPIAIVDT